jgi:hypothetical protein
VIYTYLMRDFLCSPEEGGCEIKGGFSVDSVHFAASGNTDISSFITDLSFTLVSSDFGVNLTFDLHQTGAIMVTPTGNLTPGPDKGAPSYFSGSAATNTVQLQVWTNRMLAEVTLIGDDGGTNLTNGGEWRIISPPPMGKLVPEPATWALFGVGALMLAVYGQRRRNRSAKIAYAS